MTGEDGGGETKREHGNRVVGRVRFGGENLNWINLGRLVGKTKNMIKARYEDWEEVDKNGTVA